MPRVSIGLPVWNGERYLAETLRHLQEQTLGDLEIVISDNASTDATREICESAAAADERVRYHRGEVNRGAAWNHNQAFRLARGEYFKWAAADDLCLPEFVARCVEVLDCDATAVLALPATVEVDAGGQRLGRWEYSLDLSSPDVVERFRHLLATGYECYHIYGLIRSRALRQTGLIGHFIESDMVTLAELSLHGRFVDLADELFLHRLHSDQSVTIYPSLYDRAGWFDTTKARRLTFPTWRFAVEYTRGVARAPLGPEMRRACRREVAAWAWLNRRKFLRDFKQAALRLRAREVLPAGEQPSQPFPP